MKYDPIRDAEPFDLEAALGPTSGVFSELLGEAMFGLPELLEEEFLDSELPAPVTGFRPTPVETPGGGRIRNKTPPNSAELVTVPGASGGGIQLHRLAAEAWNAMVATARADGLASPLLLPTSGYRSPERQRQLWDDALRRYGSATEARKWVAPPGGSAHQTGRAIDFYLGGRNSSANVGVLRTLPAYQWLVANAHRFGFYPYSNEPWHWEYNPPSTGGGTPLAASSGFRPTLRRGSRGPAVSDLQARLNAWFRTGAAPGVRPLTVDGGFGPLTQAAVVTLQRARGLVVNGVVGPQTWRALLAR